MARPFSSDLKPCLTMGKPEVKLTLISLIKFTEKHHDKNMPFRRQVFYLAGEKRREKRREKKKKKRKINKK